MDKYLNRYFRVKKVICTISLPLFTGSAVEHFEQAYRDGLFHRIIGTNVGLMKGTDFAKFFHLHEELTDALEMFDDLSIPHLLQ